MLSSKTQKIRETVVLSAWIGKDIKLTKRGQEFLALCPFHVEKTPSFTISDHKGFYYCFGCGARGDIFEYLKSAKNIQFQEALNMLCQELGLPLEHTNYKQNTQHTIVYEILEQALQWFENNLNACQGEKARLYLKTRNIKDQTIEKFRLGFAAGDLRSQNLYQHLLKKGFTKEHILTSGVIVQKEQAIIDKFQGRIIFPIFDYKKRPIAFGGRLLESNSLRPKYLNSCESELFHKSQILYNYHNALNNISKDSSFILVEGYLDVLSLEQNGFTTAVAPLGTAISSYQLSSLWRRSNVPIICLDGDEAGFKAALRAIERALPLITHENTLRFCYLPKGQDPDSLINQDIKLFKQILSQALPLNQAIWHSIVPSIESLKTPEQKANLRHKLFDILNKIVDSSLKELYKDDFRQKFKELFSVKAHQSYYQTQKIITPIVNKKNLQIEKILLATLINHPTLIESVLENFVNLDLKDPFLTEVKDFIISNLMLEPINYDSFKQKLENKFSNKLKDFYKKELYDQAPFCNPCYNSYEALQKWQEIWEQKILKHKMQQDLKDLYQQNDFDEKAWHRMQSLKNSLL